MKLRDCESSPLALTAQRYGGDALARTCLEVEALVVARLKKQDITCFEAGQIDDRQLKWFKRHLQRHEGVANGLRTSNQHTGRLRPPGMDAAPRSYQRGRTQ